jgi:hypothetical protein
LDAVLRRFMNAIAVGAAAVLLSRIEQHLHRYRVDDRGTATDVIAVGVSCAGLIASAGLDTTGSSELY